MASIYTFSFFTIKRYFFAKVILLMLLLSLPVNKMSSMQQKPFYKLFSRLFSMPTFYFSLRKFLPPRFCTLILTHLYLRIILWYFYMQLELFHVYSSPAAKSSGTFSHINRKTKLTMKWLTAYNRLLSVMMEKELLECVIIRVLWRMYLHISGEHKMD